MQEGIAGVVNPGFDKRIAIFAGRIEVSESKEGRRFIVIYF